MEPTFRGAGTQSGIAAAPVQHPANLWQCTRNTASTALRSWAQTRPPGTEFLDAETRRQNWSFKRANARRDQNPRIEWPEIPAENALFGVVSETCGLQGLGGGGSWAQTGDPPPSHRTGLRPRRERKFPMQRQAGESRLIT